MKLKLFLIFMFAGLAVNAQWMLDTPLNGIYTNAAGQTTTVLNITNTSTTPMTYSVVNYRAPTGTVHTILLVRPIVGAYSVTPAFATNSWTFTVDTNSPIMSNEVVSTTLIYYRNDIFKYTVYSTQPTTNLYSIERYRASNQF